MTDGVDFNTSIDTESMLFAGALGQAAPDAPVPTCPGWRGDDLLWHLAEVQHFWATIIREGLTEAEQVERIKPTRPTDRDDLLTFFHQARESLGSALSTFADDSTERWTWSDDHTVGFIRRRQAHEALIHRVDAEETAGRRTPLEPRLCGDGVDEALRVMYAGSPAWGTFTPDGRLIRIEASDVERSWLVATGRFTGDEPAGVWVDEPDLRVVDGPDPAVTASIIGSAADLDCWLWNRPGTGDVERAGDPAALAVIDSIIATPIN